MSNHKNKESAMEEFQKEEPNQDALFDGIMQKVGNDGPFQRRFNYLYNIGLVVCASMVYMNIILAMNVPDYWCHVPGRDNTSISEELWKNLTLPRDTDNRGVETHSSCKMFANVEAHVLQEYMRNTTENPDMAYPFPYNETTKCLSGYEYDHTYYQRTAVTQENWVCDKDLYVTNTFVFNRLGEVVGTFIIGQMGDLLGRRITFYTSVFVSVIGRLMIMSTSWNYVLFSISAVVGSLTSISLFQAPLIIAMETSNPDARGQIAMWQCMGWTLGMCILPMVFWVVGDWIWFLALTSIPTLIFLGFPYYMIESPRWLANKQKFAKCAEMLNRIATVNKKTIRYTEHSLRQLFGKQEEEKVYGMMSLLSHWRLLRNTICLILGWTISNIAYLTIMLNCSRMAGNPFMNFFWQSIIELPAYILGQYYGDRIGRRFTNMGSFVGAGLFCIPVIMLVKNPDLEIYATGCAIMIKFFVSINFYISNLQAMETYPTCLRQTGISIGSIVANIFGMLGPYIVLLGTNFDARYPYMILLGFFIVGTVVMLFLPETLHQKLPETLRDAEEFGKDQPFWYLPKPVHSSNANEGAEGPVSSTQNGHSTEYRFANGAGDVEKEGSVLEKLNQPEFAT